MRGVGRATRRSPTPFTWPPQPGYARPSKARTAAMRGPTARQAMGVGAVVGVRALSDYDALFDLTPAVTDAAAVAARARLEVVR
jgi:hypothetical protein